jgi:hypothetical protein
MKFHPIVVTGLLLSIPSLLRAGCCERHEAADAFKLASAIGDYRILSAETIAGPGGTLYTRFTASLNQVLKGDAPAQLVFTLPGGRLGALTEVSSLGLDLSAGDDCIFHLRREADGSWTPKPFQSHRNRGTLAEKKALRDFFRDGARGRMPKPATEVVSQENSGVPGSRLTPTGYFENASGVPCRFITCDSGVPIPCLVDIDPTKLPAGTDATEALGIVQDALDAWSEVSSLKFQIEGTVSFGNRANNIAASDGKLRIQLHDTFNAIPSTDTLGIGGVGITGTAGSGATIAGRTFLKLTRGYVVLNHRSTSMANPLNFAEVLTHEIGHALGLTHSSGVSTETEPVLKDATMYYAAHQDGRGADVRLYDEDRIRFGYPLNTPPFSTDRILRAVIASTGNPKAPNADPAGVGVDRITVTGGDLQGTPVTVSLVAGTDPAMFTLSGNTILYTSPGNYSDILNLAPEDIAAGNYYHQALFTLSDGVNLSAAYSFNITGFHRDSAPADGLPGSWLQTYFGLQNVGALGSAHHPLSDPDKDGLDNRTERYLGTSPIDPNSGPAKMTFNPQTRTLTLHPVRFAPYVIEASANLGTWSTRTTVTTFSPPAGMSIPVTGDAAQPRMFYRARVAP